MNIPFPKYVQEPENTPRERVKPSEQELRRLKAKNTPVQKAVVTAPVDPQPANPHWQKYYRLLRAGQALATTLLATTTLLAIGTIGSIAIGLFRKTEPLYMLNITCLCLLCAGGLLHLSQKLLKRLDSLQERL